MVTLSILSPPEEDLPAPGIGVAHSGRKAAPCGHALSACAFASLAFTVIAYMSGAVSLGTICNGRLRRKGSSDCSICRRAWKFSVPRPVTCESQSQPTSRSNKKTLPRLTGSHPVIAGNPRVPQPGFEPSVMSLKPVRPLRGRLYSQGLRNPSGTLPFESK